MGADFNSYYIWLGIPPEDQPPHHYRLLGVTLFENNREVIEAAANRQMAYMQEVSSGEEHIDEAQKILGELSRARVCLLNSEKKADYDAELRDSFDALVPASESLATPPVAADEAEQSAAATAKKQSSLAIVVIALLIIFFGGLWLLFNRSETDEEKPVVQQSLESPDVEQENPELEEANRKLAEAKKQAEAAEQKLKEQEARNAAAEAKKQVAAEAKKQAAAEAKKQAAAEAKKQAAAEAKKQVAAEAKKKAEAEKKAAAAATKEAEKEAAKQKAAEEAERKAQELRDNPDKLLENKGFEQKGKRWVFAKEEKLKQVTKKLTNKWREWKKRTPQNENDIKAKLEIYNKLLLESFEISAMRMAVSEDFHEALDDPDVDAALSELEVKTPELSRNVRALTKPDPKLKRAVPRQSPVIGSEGNFYAALIINEKESVVVHIDQKLLGKKDAPSLFFLPRHVQAKANLRLTGAPQKWMNNTYRAPMLESKVLKLRIGLKAAQNFPINFHPTPAEGGAGNGESTYGGKVGMQAWQAFCSQLKPAEVTPSQNDIAKARKKLDAFAIQLKEKK